MLGQLFLNAISWVFPTEREFIHASELGDTARVEAYLQRSHAEKTLLENNASSSNLFSASFSANNVISAKTLSYALMCASKNGHVATTERLFQACMNTAELNMSMLGIFKELLAASVPVDILRLIIQSDWIRNISDRDLHKIAMHPIVQQGMLMPILDNLANLNTRMMTVITAVPYGSFGDPSAACKLMGNMQKNYPLIRFNWLVIPIQSPNFRLTNYTERLDSNTVTSYELSHTNEIVNHRELLNNSDLIISFPTHHWITDQHAFLYQQNIPVISIMEYDSNIYHDVKANIPFNMTINGPMVLQTGLNPKALGLFLSNNQPPSKAELITRLDHIKENSDHPDSSILNVLFGKQSVDAYLSSNNFYFGYFNKEDHSVHPLCKVNPAKFLMAAIHKARLINPNIKQIDFMIRVENIEHLQSLQHKLRAKGINAKICFYNHDTYSEIRDLDSNSESSFDLTIRVINPFPTKPETFQALQILSDPFCALTGDQSFSEGLDKIFFYQAMRWKMRLFESFLDIVKACCGNNSELYLFYAMQINRTEKSLDVLFETLINAYHEAGGNVQSFFEDLQTQANIVSNYVKTNKDLEQTLPQILNDIMYNPVETICHNHNHFIDMPHDLMLASLYYPDQSIHLYRRFMETDNASSLLSEHNSEQLRLLRLSCQVEEPNPAKRKRCNLEEIEAPATTKKSKVKARKDA
jgi:hypothetical protein